MIWLSLYMIGFVITTLLVFMTGGENHTRGNEWYWVWFNIVIWPFWWILFGLAALHGCYDRWFGDKSKKY